MQNTMITATELLTAEILTVFTKGTYSKVILLTDTGASMPVFRREIAALVSQLQNALALSCESWSIKSENIGDRISQTGHEECCLIPENAFVDGGNLIILVSDRVSRRWQENAARWLQSWGKSNFVTILSLLPKRSFSFVASDYSNDATLRSGGFPENNLQLPYEQPWWYLDDVESTADFVKVPVVFLESKSIVCWGRFMAGTDATTGLVYADAATLARWSEGVQTLEDNKIESVEKRMSRYQMWASNDAVKLAQHICLAGPATLPLMEAIQEQFLPDSERLALAEVLLGGLHAPSGHCDGNALERKYQVRQDVVAFLRDRTSSAIVFNTLEFVGEYYGRQYPQFSFDEFLRAAMRGQALFLDKQLIGFARVVISIYSEAEILIAKENAKILDLAYEVLENI